MKIIVALPDHNYFLWQMLVQINNFRKFGFEKDVVYVIGKRGLNHNVNLDKIIKDSTIKCSFAVLKDDREMPKYPSSLRPHILKKYFKRHPELEGETIFYVDPDVIFTKKMKFGDLEKNNNWYLSDTRSYIGVNYIKSKGDDLLKEMANIFGISPSIIQKNDKNAGGAQYLMKNVNWKFWEEVENKSEELYQFLIESSTKYSPKHPIQAWTADMWAVLWLAWKYGHNTKIIKRFNFSWATDLMKKWDENSIYHNAGVVNKNGALFNKTEHQISPFNKEMNYDDNYCSFNYVKEIKETEKNFKNLIF